MTTSSFRDQTVQFLVTTKSSVLKDCEKQSSILTCKQNITIIQLPKIVFTSSYQNEKEEIITTFLVTTKNILEVLQVQTPKQLYSQKSSPHHRHCPTYTLWRNFIPPFPT